MSFGHSAKAFVSKVAFGTITVSKLSHCQKQYVLTFLRFNAEKKFKFLQRANDYTLKAVNLGKLIVFMLHDYKD